MQDDLDWATHCWPACTVFAGGQQFDLQVYCNPKRVDGPGPQQPMRQEIRTREGFRVTMEDNGFVIECGDTKRVCVPYP